MTDPTEQRLKSLAVRPTPSGLHERIMQAVAQSDRRSGVWLEVVTLVVLATSLVNNLRTVNSGDLFALIRLALAGFQLTPSYLADFGQMILDSIPTITLINFAAILVLVALYLRAKHSFILDRFHFSRYARLVQ